MSKKQTKKRRRTHETLARELGVSGNSVRKWAARPDAPRSMSADVWRRFIDDNQLGSRRMSPERESLLERLADRKLRLLDLEIARKEQRTVLRADVDALHLQIATRQKVVLYAALESEYPGKVVGRTAAEIRIAGRQIADRICDVFTRDLSEWRWTPDGS